MAPRPAPPRGGAPVASGSCAGRPADPLLLDSARLVQAGHERSVRCASHTRAAPRGGAVRPGGRRSADDEARGGTTVQEAPPHAVRLDAPAAGGRCPLRAPDSPLEPQDEALHLRRAQRHPHHRPGPDGQPAGRRARLRDRHRRQRRLRPLRGHQEAGPGARRRGGHPRRDALRQPPLAGRHAHQLRDHPQAHRSARPARGPAGQRRPRPAAPRRRPPASPTRWRACSSSSAACARCAACRAPSSSSTRSASTSRSPRRAARDPGHRHRRHERRPGPDRLHHPRQRRRHPRHPAALPPRRRRRHRGPRSAGHARRGGAASWAPT